MKKSDSIKTYGDLEAFMLKYGSKNKIAKFKANQEKVKTLPSYFINQLIALAKDSSLKEITTIQESINGNTATLNVRTTKPELTGIITLVLENNQWKLELESWKQQGK